MSYFETALVSTLFCSPKCSVLNTVLVSTLLWYQQCPGLKNVMLSTLPRSLYCTDLNTILISTLSWSQNYPSLNSVLIITRSCCQHYPGFIAVNSELFSTLPWLADCLILTLVLSALSLVTLTKTQHTTLPQLSLADCNYWCQSRLHMLATLAILATLWLHWLYWLNWLNTAVHCTLQATAAGGTRKLQNC